MKLKMQSIHFDADRKLLAFIQEKIDKLTRYYDGIVGGEVVLRLDNNRNSENKIIQIIGAAGGRGFAPFVLASIAFCAVFEIYINTRRPLRFGK